MSMLWMWFQFRFYVINKAEQIALFQNPLHISCCLSLMAFNSPHKLLSLLIISFGEHIVEGGGVKGRKMIILSHKYSRKLSEPKKTWLGRSFLCVSVYSTLFITYMKTLLFLFRLSLFGSRSSDRARKQVLLFLISLPRHFGARRFKLQRLRERLTRRLTKHFFFALTFVQLLLAIAAKCTRKKYYRIESWRNAEMSWKINEIIMFERALFTVLAFATLMQLWLWDFRLAYFHFVASNSPSNAMPVKLFSMECRQKSFAT